MNALDTTVTISDWFSDSYLRSVVITCFLTGFTLGALFSRHAFEFLRWYIEWKRRIKQEDRARREAAVQRRLESMRRRAEKRDEERNAAELDNLLEELDISPGGGYYTPKGEETPRYCVRCLRNRHEKVPLRTSGINNACPRCGYRCISN